MGRAVHRVIKDKSYSGFGQHIQLELIIASDVPLAFHVASRWYVLECIHFENCDSERTSYGGNGIFLAVLSSWDIIITTVWIAWGCAVCNLQFAWLPPKTACHSWGAQMTFWNYHFPPVLKLFPGHLSCFIATCKTRTQTRQQVLRYCCLSLRPEWRELSAVLSNYQSHWMTSNSCCAHSNDWFLHCKYTYSICVHCCVSDNELNLLHSDRLAFRRCYTLPFFKVNYLTLHWREWA